MTLRRDTIPSRAGFLAAVVLLVLLSIAQDASAQLTLRGTANPVINITTGTAGGTMTSVVNTSSQIRYTRKSVYYKITVRTTCASQAFSLEVLATGVTRGVAQGAIPLTNGMAARDFIRDIPSTGGWTTATPTLQYTASATFAQGNSAELGNDVHTVTYTYQVQ